MLFLSDNMLKHLIPLLQRYHIQLIWCESDDIPGSYWGAPEAGIIANRVYYNAKTPVHSVLHESCHYVCMDSQRRANLHTNTGGDYLEENAVCYLQILLAEFLPDMGKIIMCKDMDDWGYSFRLGSALSWYKDDAEDAQTWLIKNKLLNSNLHPTWRVRT